MSGFRILIISILFFNITSCDNGQRNTAVAPAELPVLSSSNETVNSGARLNPAHGEPGHRCDIAVGAPLDTKPTVQPGILSGNQLTPTPTNTPQTTVQSTAQGLNPAHGQPGHRCDIAVGAPLNSKPATQTNSSTATTTSVPVSISQTPTQTVAPGMNPAHGQPGHRCDIAVGAPLNSKPNPAPAQPTVPLLPVKIDSSNR